MVKLVFPNLLDEQSPCSMDVQQDLGLVFHRGEDLFLAMWYTWAEELLVFHSFSSFDSKSFTFLHETTIPPPSAYAHQTKDVTTYQGETARQGDLYVLGWPPLKVFN